MEALLVAFIVSGNARFTPLTPEMIRMEWSPTGQFEDRPSMLFIDRDPDLPRFAVTGSYHHPMILGHEQRQVMSGDSTLAGPCAGCCEAFN